MEKSNIYSTGIVVLTVHSVTYRLSAYLSTVYTHYSQSVYMHYSQSVYMQYSYIVYSYTA